MPMSAESRWGEIDFSPAGATLYRMISAEWLDPNWEDDLHVSNTYHWEEHRYCESAAGFEYIAQEHVAKGAIIRASCVLPIGVYWWERFPRGYRLELELSDSCSAHSALPAAPALHAALLLLPIRPFTVYSAAGGHRPVL
jgi:hypothetical protein